MIIWHWIMVSHFWIFTLISLAVAAALAYVPLWVKAKEEFGPPAILAALVYLFWFFVALVKFINFVPTGLKLLNQSVGPMVKLPVLVLTIATIGSALYIFRVYRRTEYGLAETVFALASIYVASSKSLSGPLDGNSWTTLVGGAYLLVRGLDNVTTDKSTASIQFQKKWIEDIRSKTAGWWDRFKNPKAEARS
jgi:hypothetical protein